MSASVTVNTQTKTASLLTTWYRGDKRNARATKPTTSNPSVGPIATRCVNSITVWTAGFRGVICH